MGYSRKQFLISLAKQPRKWYRVGGGHYFEFDACDQVIGACLDQALLPEFAPYVLIAVVVGRDTAGNDAWVYESHEVSEYCQLRRRGCTRFRIRSMKLTPYGDLATMTDPWVFSSLAGMLDLQLPHPKDKPRPSPPEIGMVRKAAWLDGTHLVEHVEYYKIYQRLKRAFKDHIIKRNRRPPKPAAD